MTAPKIKIVIDAPKGSGFCRVRFTKRVYSNEREAYKQLVCLHRWHFAQKPESYQRSLYTAFNEVDGTFELVYKLKTRSHGDGYSKLAIQRFALEDYRFFIELLREGKFDKYLNELEGGTE